MAKSRKKKKNKFFKGFITFIIIIAIIAVGGFLCYKSYLELQLIANDVQNFQYNLPTELNDKIDLPTKIGDKVKIEWNSSNKQVLSNDGKITYPSFEDGDVKVKLTGKIIIEFEEILSEYLIQVIGIEINDLEYEIIIPAKQATDEDKVQNVFNKLSLIDKTFTSINLPTALCYDNLMIDWESSNPNVINEKGDVTTPTVDTSVVLKARIILNDCMLEKEFNIIVLAKEPILDIVDDNFDNQAATSKYSTITSTSGVKYYNARIMEVDGASSSDNDVNSTIPSFIRLRNQDENNGYFEILDVTNPVTFAFKYQFSGSQKTESSKIVITLLSNNKEEKIEFIVKHTNEYLDYNLDLNQYNYDKVSIRVEHIDEWSGDTYLDIDDVDVDTSPTISNAIEWVINNTPTSITQSLILPFTTEFGGKITWESSNPTVITNDGIVNRFEESKNVTLTATVLYLDQTATLTIEVVIKGKGSVQALEIYFIDIGKYGAGDCGECTYIKYGDVDIIVDAGDHFSSTIQAVTESINQRLEDDVIEYVIATHPDGDHIGGMAALFENFTIETLIKFEGEYTTQKYQKMRTAYINEGCEVYEIKSDIIDQNKGNGFITLNSDVFINFIDTSYYTSDESNGKSIVFTLEAYGTKVLMTGDADNAAGHTDLEQKYMNQVGDIDILKVVHHGTANGTSIDYLNIVDPEVAIICNGNYLGNKHGHPHPTAIKNLYTYDTNIKVYAITGGGTIDGVVNKSNNTYKCSSEDRFNQRNGLITIVIDNNGYTLTSEYYGNNILELKETLYYKAITENNLG